MEDADLILKWTEDLKAEIELLAFSKDDIRADFFGMLYDAVYNFYRGYVAFVLSTFIKDGEVAFNDRLIKFKTHIDRISETSTHSILVRSQMNYLNRHLLVDAWSNFELCVTTFVGAICNQDEYEKMMNHHFKDIMRCMKGSQINNHDEEKLKLLTKKTHLTHVPIVRKTDFLFSKANNYYRDVKEDKEFLSFLGRWRNTMHTNFIYHGNDYEYKYGQAHFKFESGKMVKWYDPFEPSPRLYIFLVGNLKEIWKMLINTIKFEDFIPYPDPEQE